MIQYLNNSSLKLQQTTMCRFTFFCCYLLNTSSCLNCFILWNLVDSSRNAASRIPTSMSSAQKSSGSRIALSQPGSRSTSPTPKYSYLTHNNALATPTLSSNTAYLHINNTASYDNASFNQNVTDLALSPGLGNIGLTTLRVNGSGGGNSSGGSVRLPSSTIKRSKIPTSSRNSSRESSPGRRSSKKERLCTTVKPC